MIIWSPTTATPRRRPGMERWNPDRTCTRQEQFILKRLKRNGKLFAFLRLHRHELFDDAFQAELESMYRDTGAGTDPNPPAFMPMVIFLHSYTCASDATAVELALLGLRCQMARGSLCAVDPAFSQG